jgi:hypothetical protein
VWQQQQQQQQHREIGNAVTAAKCNAYVENQSADFHPATCLLWLEGCC